RAMASERADDLVGAAQLAVRDRDSVANRGRAEPLALAQHRGQVLEPDVRVFGRQSLGEFLEHLVLGASLQIGEDHFGSEDFGDFHRMMLFKWAGGCLTPSSPLLR